MLVDSIKKYYEKKYDLNCAETMLYAANEEYKLNLSRDTLKTMSAFGGGMAVESVCGALTGALVVIGIMFTRERGHESDRIKKLAGEFYNNFREKLGTDNCRELKDKYRNEEERCIKMVMTAAEILDGIIEREQKQS